MFLLPRPSAHVSVPSEAVMTAVRSALMVARLHLHSCREEANTDGREEDVRCKREMKSPADAAECDWEKISAREDGREMQARALQDSTLRNSVGFGMTSTVAWWDMHVKMKRFGSGGICGEVPRSPRWMAGRHPCASGFAKGRKPGAKCSSDRDGCNVELRAHGESCMLRDPAIVHGED